MQMGYRQFSYFNEEKKYGSIATILFGQKIIIHTQNSRSCCGQKYSIKAPLKEAIIEVKTLLLNIHNSGILLPNQPLRIAM